MSSPPSAHSNHLGVGTERTTRKDRPPALDFHAHHAPSADEARPEREAGTSDASQVNAARISPEPRLDTCLTTHGPQPRLHVSNPDGDGGGDDDDDDETELALPRSPSATSSLDPYYFGVSTPSESPVQSSPMPPQLTIKTPELGPFHDPVTPRRDPAAIDRRGLVGVGELATPRWARGQRKEEVEVDQSLEEEVEDDLDDGLDDADFQEKERDLPDSPWTIEAIDGEQEENDEVSAPL